MELCWDARPLAAPPTPAPAPATATAPAPDATLRKRARAGPSLAAAVTLDNVGDSDGSPEPWDFDLVEFAGHGVFVSLFRAGPPEASRVGVGSAPPAVALLGLASLTRSSMRIRQGARKQKMHARGASRPTMRNCSQQKDQMRISARWPMRRCPKRLPRSSCAPPRSR